MVVTKGVLNMNRGWDEMSKQRFGTFQTFGPILVLCHTLVSGKDMAQKRQRQLVPTKTQNVLKPQLSNINGGRKAIKMLPT